MRKTLSHADADNSQTAAGDQVTTLSAEDNEHSNSMVTVSNHNQSNAPLAAPTPLAPLDATPLQDSLRLGHC